MKNALPCSMASSYRSRMSLETVSWLANWALLISLVVGVVATYGIVVTGNLKEQHFKKDLAAEQAHAAQLEKDAEMLRYQNTVTERRLYPRGMEHDQSVSFMEYMKRFTGKSVTVESYGLDVEAA
jgi:hypothetical protein